MATYKALKDINHKVLGKIKAGTVIGYVPPTLVEPMASGGFIEINESVKTTYRPDKTFTDVELEQAETIDALQAKVADLEAQLEQATAPKPKPVTLPKGTKATKR